MEKNNTLTGQLEGAFSSIGEGAEALAGTFGGVLLKGAGGFLVSVKGAKDQVKEMSEGANTLKDSFGALKTFFKPNAEGGGIKNAFKSFMGKGKGETPAAAETPTAPAAGGDQSGQASKFGKINPTEMIKAAAALLIIAAAVWVFAKALQEFASVDFGAALKGIGLLVLLAGVAILLGMVSSLLIMGAIGLAAVSVALLIFGAAVNVLGAGMILLGEGFASMAAGIKDLDVGKLALFGLALIPLAIGMAFFGLFAPAIIIGALALSILAAALAALAPALSLISTVMPEITANLTPLVGMIMQIFGLAAAITTLGLALGVLGTMGILALPILQALGAGGLIKVLGGDSGGKKESAQDKLLEEIIGLRQDMTDGKIAVYLDGKKMNTGLAISNKRQPS
jgi:hypothetical protein